MEGVGGLGQINVGNFERLGLTLDAAFEPCTNLGAMQSVLAECFDRARAPAAAFTPITAAATPTPVDQTALPIKFAATIEEALGRAPDRPARFEGIEALPRRVRVLPADAAGVKALVARECE